MNQKLLTIIMLAVLGVVLASAFGYFALTQKQTPTAFVSKEDCEQKTGKSCGFAMCDYIPEGKTFEEVCGRDFRPGWQPY